MTQPNPTDTAADRLSHRVEQAQARTAARADRAAASASTAAGSAVKLIKDHPLATIGGAIAIGAIVAQVLPGKIGKGSRKRSRRALDLAAKAAALALAYGKRTTESAADSGRDNAIKLGHAGHELGDRMAEAFNHLARELGNRLGDTSEMAQKHGSELAESATDFARDASTLAARKLRELAAKLDS